MACLSSNVAYFNPIDPDCRHNAPKICFTKMQDSLVQDIVKHIVEPRKLLFSISATCQAYSAPDLRIGHSSICGVFFFFPAPLQPKHYPHPNGYELASHP